MLLLRHPQNAENGADSVKNKAFENLLNFFATFFGTFLSEAR